MIRGTTPTLRFTLPFDTAEVAALYITIDQTHLVTVEKSLADCTLVGSTVSFRLTQEDTLKLVQSVPAQIQVRLKTTDGTAMASNVFETPVEKILKEGAI